MTDIKKEIGERLKKIRENKNFKQNRIAKSLGIHPSTLAKYESGEREPDNETLIKLAEIYEVSIDYLLCKTSNPNHTVDEIAEFLLANLDLSDEEIMKKINLIIDGKPVTKDETRRFIAFVRADRAMKEKSPD